MANVSAPVRLPRAIQGLTARPASGCVAEARTLLLPVTKASVVTGTAWDAVLPLGTLEQTTQDARQRDGSIWKGTA